MFPPVTSEIETIRHNQSVVDELRYTVESVDHLEALIIDKIRFRRAELDTLSNEYESAIRAYSNIIMQLVES